MALQSRQVSSGRVVSRWVRHVSTGLMRPSAEGPWVRLWRDCIKPEGFQGSVRPRASSLLCEGDGGRVGWARRAVDGLSGSCGGVETEYPGDSARKCLMPHAKPCSLLVVSCVRRVRWGALRFNMGEGERREEEEEEERGRGRDRTQFSNPTVRTWFLRVYHRE